MHVVPAVTFWKSPHESSSGHLFILISEILIFFRNDMQRNVLRYVLKVQNLFCHTPNRFRSRKSEQLKSTRPRTDTHFFNKMAKANENSIKPQIYDYFLVLDFEATCIEGKKIVPQVALSI